MTDNIREKLVELLKRDPCPSTYLCDRNCNYADLERCFEERFADHLIANNVTVQEWVSVEDRLPEEGKDVLAFCYWHESWEVQVCHLSSNWSGQWYTSIAGQWVAVSHWQYLPTPPKGE